MPSVVAMDTHARESPHVDIGVYVAGGLHMLSLGFVLWNIVLLVKLPAPCRSRSLPRQLLALAVADSVMHVCWVAHALKQALSFANCRSLEWFMMFTHIGTDASLLFEICIALLFLLKSFGCPKAMAMLKYSPFVVLAASLVLSLQEPIKYQWDGVACHWTFHRNVVFAVLTLACVFVSTISLALGAIRLRCSQAPDSVNKRALRRVMAYVLNAVITELPLALSMGLGASVGYIGDGTPFHTFAYCCQACNGMLNTIMFFRQTRYASEGIRQVALMRDKDSFAVMFADAPEGGNNV